MTELTTDNKLFIIDSKIAFLNETIYNYDLDLQLFSLEQGVDPDRQPVQDIIQYRENALAKLAFLETAKQELLSNN
jgi:hypothetical protein